MYWRLRIPLFLFGMGLISAFVQRYPNFFFIEYSSFIGSAIFIGLLILVYKFFEVTKINDKRIHFLKGIGLIVLGVFVDSVFV